MAGLEAGRGRKGKNFTAEEETCLCRSFLAVSQDPVCGNGQRNTAFWERITAHFNRVKARGSPLRPSRSLETKWGSIKHNVSKFCGAYKQVLDCRESGTSMDDVLYRALEYYRDRHPKQQGFTFLHCWTLLREVPRWWESPLDVQKRNHGGEGSPGGVAMAARRAATQMATDVAEGDAQEPANDGEGGSAEGEGLGSVEIAARELVRPRGQKAAKGDLIDVGRRDSILKSQARATEQMAAANMRKAEAMQDHFAMALFKMNLDELDGGAREYFELRRSEELDRIKRRIEAEKRVADRENAEHDRLMQERALDGFRGKRPRTAVATANSRSAEAPSRIPDSRTAEVPSRIPECPTAEVPSRNSECRSAEFANAQTAPSPNAPPSTREDSQLAGEDQLPGGDLRESCEFFHAGFIFFVFIDLFLAHFGFQLCYVQMTVKVTTGRIQGLSQTPSTTLKHQAFNLVFLDIEM
jgi:hypothetical protein